MTPIQVFAAVKSWVKSYVIPSNAVPLPLPRNQLAADVQQSLQRADNEPQIRHDEIQTAIDTEAQARQGEVNQIMQEKAELANIVDGIRTINVTGGTLSKTIGASVQVPISALSWHENLVAGKSFICDVDGTIGIMTGFANAENTIINVITKTTSGADLNGIIGRINSLEDDFTDHVENEIVHITQQERNKWNSGTGSGGSYEPPVGGIPRSDLSQDVQTSLGKADTALQSYTETDPVYTADKPNLALKSEMESADTALENMITQNETDISNNKINSLSFNQPTKVLSVNTGYDTISETLPEATSTMAGLMASADVVALNQNTQDIQSLKAFAFVPLGTLSVTNETFALMLDSGKDAQVLADLGINTFTDNDAIKTSNNVTWIVANSATTRTWRPWGDTPIHIATNTTLGIVKGTEIPDPLDESADGRGYIENDGSTSTIGFDRLKNRVLSVETNKADNTQDVTPTAAENIIKFSTGLISQTIGTWILQIAQKINGIISALSNKQSNIPAGTNGYLVTHSGSVGTTGTPKNPADFMPSNGQRTEITAAFNFNTATIQGRFIKGTSSYALTNAPTGMVATTPFKLDVDIIGNIGEQRVLIMGDNNIFGEARRYITSVSGQTFGTWRYFLWTTATSASTTLNTQS